jgi:hypothetical protein
MKVEFLKQIFNGEIDPNKMNFADTYVIYNSRGIFHISKYKVDHWKVTEIKITDTTEPFSKPNEKLVKVSNWLYKLQEK